MSRSRTDRFARWLFAASAIAASVALVATMTTRLNRPALSGIEPCVPPSDRSPGPPRPGLIGLPPSWAVAVHDAPFDATIVLELTPPAGTAPASLVRRVGRMARDSQGRIRRELDTAGLDFGSGTCRTVITDAVAGVEYRIDDERRAAVRVMLSTGGAGTRDRRRAPGLAAPREAPAPATEITTERRYARDLRLAVFSRRTGPTIGEVEYRLTGLTRGEPPASLFTVPEGYAVMTLPARSSLP